MSDEEILHFLLAAFKAKARIEGPAHEGVDMTIPKRLWTEQYNAFVQEVGFNRVLSLAAQNNIKIV